MKMKRVAQVAIEVLVLMGIIVIGSIILGVTYINTHNKNIQISSDVSVVQGEVQKELQYTGAYNPSSVSCGNLLCELDFGETIASCPQDCPETTPPAIQQDCTSVSAPTFSPANGLTLNPNSQITISKTTDTNCDNFRIYYTDTNNGVDPTVPNLSSTQYSTPILASSLANPSEGSSVTLKMKAIVYADSLDGDPNDVNSSVTSVTYTVTKPYCFSGTGSGSGTREDPKIICTAKELNDVRNNLNWYYILGQDINLSPVALSGEDWYNPERGWNPIGDSTTAFTGSFDGNGHKLLNNYISVNDSYKGLFGYIKNPAIIKNLYIIDTNITASNNVGALVGYFEKGTIENCSATGNIFVSNNNKVGGLIGESNSGEVKESFADVNVTGNTDLGGLIGSSFETEISNCFSRGAVLGTSRFAGLIGQITNGSVSFSYSTGLVSKRTWGSSETKSGLISRNSGATIKNSYWDKETSRQDQSAGGEGKTTADMKNEHTFENWEFVNIWAIKPEINNGYPYLRNNLIIKTE